MVSSSHLKPPPEPQPPNHPQAHANHNPHPIGRLLRSSAEFIVLWELLRSVMRGDNYMLPVSTGGA